MDEGKNVIITNKRALTVEDLTDAIDCLIGRTMRSVTDKEVERAFETGFKEWRK